MTRNDVLCKPSWQRMRSRSLTMEHRVIVVLRTFIVLVPPLAERRHVVAGYGANRAVWVLAEMSEARCGRLWHALQLKAEYLQLFHHPRNTVGHHAEVLSANEHTCGLYQLGQLLHSLTIPELIVATIIIVVV